MKNFENKGVLKVAAFWYVWLDLHSNDQYTLVQISGLLQLFTAQRQYKVNV